MDREPSTLYHYTDASGLVGIVNPSPSAWPLPCPTPEKDYKRVVKLLASDVRYMNDSDELKVGARLLQARLGAAALDPATPEEFRVPLTEIKSIFDEKVLDWDLRAFASCFCEDGDLLSQWRGYAGGTGGFALGLDRAALETRTKVFNRFPSAASNGISTSDAVLKPVIYGEKAAEAAVDATIQGVIASDWKDVVTDQRPEAVGHARLVLALQLFPAVATIKAMAFEEEREWRLFSPYQSRYLVRVRARQRGLVPYTEIGVNLPWGPPEQRFDHQANPTIVDLVVGPGPEQPEQVLAARQLLANSGHDPDVVRASAVTYR